MMTPRHTHQALIGAVVVIPLLQTGGIESARRREWSRFVNSQIGSGANHPTTILLPVSVVAQLLHGPAFSARE
jgi:hypothetical protein